MLKNKLTFFSPLFSVFFFFFLIFFYAEKWFGQSRTGRSGSDAPVLKLSFFVFLSVYKTNIDCFLFVAQFKIIGPR